MKKKSVYKMILLVVISLIYAIPISYSQNKAKIEKIEDVDFYNFSYPHKVIFNDKRVSTIEVQKGKFIKKDYGLKKADYCFKIVDIKYNDLTGDGKNEAIVQTLYRSSISNYYNTEIFIYSMENSQLKCLGIITQESINGIDTFLEALNEGLWVKNGILTIQYLTDCLSGCEHQQVYVFQYRWNGHQFELIAPPKKRDILALDNKITNWDSCN